MLESWVRISLTAWDARLLCSLCCAGSGFCDGLIARSEESYRVCDLETSTFMRPRHDMSCCITKNKTWVTNE
jgi:hypothetical protein